MALRAGEATADSEAPGAARAGGEGRAGRKRARGGEGGRERGGSTPPPSARAMAYSNFVPDLRVAPPPHPAADGPASPAALPLPGRGAGSEVGGGLREGLLPPLAEELSRFSSLSDQIPPQPPSETSEPHSRRPTPQGGFVEGFAGALEFLQRKLQSRKHSTSSDEGEFRESAVWRQFRTRQDQRSFTTPQSDYLALVPLSDPRLERTWSPAFLWSLGFLVACVLGLAVFLFMPRAVQIRQGDFKWGTEMIQWNRTEGTYNLTLSVDIPLQNDNFFAVQLDGDLDVFLFDQMAGNATIPPQMIPSTRGTRSKNHWLHIDIDANQLDGEYAQNVISRCSLFHPHRIVFLVQGGFTTRFLAYHAADTPVDSYCMVSCSVDPVESPGVPKLIPENRGSAINI